MARGEVNITQLGAPSPAHTRAMLPHWERNPGHTK